jgi:hypothetical protein
MTVKKKNWRGRVLRNDEALTSRSVQSTIETSGKTEYQYKLNRAMQNSTHFPNINL